MKKKVRAFVVERIRAQLLEMRQDTSIYDDLERVLGVDPSSITMDTWDEVDRFILKVSDVVNTLK